MATSSQPDGATITIFEYQNLEERGHERLELIHGNLVREPAPGGVHGVVLLDLLHTLHEHVTARGLGRVLVETGVRYPGEPGTVRSPDIAFIAAARLPPTPPLSFWRVAPDLVIEIVSPSDRWTVVQQKIEADLEAGVREVWIVDPGARRLTIHTAAAAPRVLAADDVLDAGSIVEDFTMRVRDLFSGIDSFAPQADPRPELDEAGAGH